MCSVPDVPPVKTSTVAVPVNVVIPVTLTDASVVILPRLHYSRLVDVAVEYYLLTLPC